MSDSGIPPRRRSVDVGGLNLALNNQGMGHGWGGWEQRDQGETRYAEVLIDVRAHTENIVNLEPLQLSPDIDIDSTTKSRLIESLGSWNFEPHKLPDEEVLACTYILFEALFRRRNMKEDVGVPLSQVGAFLKHLRQIYRRQNTYHNFHHALDVFQATTIFLNSAGVVPPVSILSYNDGRMWDRGRKPKKTSFVGSLSNKDIFALYIAAVGHDVGHPGLTNAFLKNAKVPLAEVYDDKSILEQMHRSLILQLMRHHGLGSLLDHPTTGAWFRNLLSLTVLATDLSVHHEFMNRYGNMVRAGSRATGINDQKILVCQALIKCADISNPSRPYGVSQHWAAALESEWQSQLLLEKHLHLPVSVKPSDNPLSEARGQVFFISHFACPLFELTATGIPDLEKFAQQCRDNLQTWKDQTAILEKQAGISPRELSLSQLPENFLSAFPPTLPRKFLSEYDQTSPNSYLSTLPSASSSSLPGSAASSTPVSSSSPYLPPSDIEETASTRQVPRLEISTNPVISPAGTGHINIQDATAAIRSAYNASVRPRRSFNRGSWSPTPAQYAAAMGSSTASSSVSASSPT